MGSLGGDKTIPAAARPLEAALLFTIVAHAAAMGTMAMMLLPGMPGGGAAPAERAAFVAGHPWIWRVGWLPWQVTAISDLLLGIAMCLTPWIPRRVAIATALITAIAMMPDQAGQALWTWAGPKVASRAMAAGDVGEYLQFETRVFRWIAAIATIGYLLGALGWTWCFAAAGIWSRRILWVSVGTWGLFSLATGVLFLPRGMRAVSRLAAVGNAGAFALLMVWLLLVTEAVMRRSRPDTQFGKHAPWRHPRRGTWWRAVEVVANSRLAREVGQMLPALAMASDIADVVYVNYLLPAERLEGLVQRPLELQRLGPEGRFALFTFLTFRHGHFGPAVFGRWRRLWPSPAQSNWRIHVVDPQTGMRGIQFLTTAITSTPYALATRLLTEGAPMHVPAQAAVERLDKDTIRVRIEAGEGSSPEVEGIFRECATPKLPPPWDVCFGDWRTILEYCVPQDRAMSAQPWEQTITCQEIELNIPLDQCKPLAADLQSETARRIADDSPPLCFIVEHVTFRFSAEQHGEKTSLHPTAGRRTPKPVKRVSDTLFTFFRANTL